MCVCSRRPIAKRVNVLQKDTDPKATELRVDDQLPSLLSFGAWLSVDITAPIVGYIDRYSLMIFFGFLSLNVVESWLIDGHVQWSER